MCQPPRRPDLLGVYHNEKCTESLLYAGYQAGVEGVENKSDSAPLVSQGRWMFSQASQATCRQEGWEQGALVLGSALLLGVHTTLLPGSFWGMFAKCLFILQCGRQTLTELGS